MVSRQTNLCNVCMLCLELVQDFLFTFFKSSQNFDKTVEEVLVTKGENLVANATDTVTMSSPGFERLMLCGKHCKVNLYQQLHLIPD